MRIITNHKDERLGAKKLHAELFDSFGEFIRYAKENINRQSSDRRSDGDWHGPKSESLDSACDLALNGWDDIRPQVDGILGDVTDRLADRLADLYKPTYDFGGAYVDMGRYVEGDPECMVNFSATADKSMGRVVKVVVAGTASSMIDPNHIIKRGIAVLALIDTINKLGFGVELWWDSTIEGRGSGNLYSTAVKLHDSADTLDINSVMFSLAHPSMLRRLTFSVQERSEKASEQGVGGGYGVPHDMGTVVLNDYDVIVEKLQNGRGDIVANPLEWVMSTLKGLELVPETV